MADTARGRVSMTPVVTIAADADADAIDAIHHDIGGSLGGKLEYEAADANDKWFYDSSKNVTTDAALLDGAFTDGSGDLSQADYLRFLQVVHTGVDSNGDSTSVNVHITLDGINPETSTTAIEIGKDESFIIKTANDTLVSDVTVSTADGSSVIVKIVAIIEDVD